MLEKVQIVFMMIKNFSKVALKKDRSSLMGCSVTEFVVYKFRSTIFPVVVYGVHVCCEAKVGIRRVCKK